MCTIMLERETLEAERMSAARANELVQELMAYDRKLAEPFTMDELKTLLEDKVKPELLYKVLNENEKQLLDQLCPNAQKEVPIKEKPFSNLIGRARTPEPELPPEDLRQWWISRIVEASSLIGRARTPEPEQPPEDLRQWWKSRFVEASSRWSREGKVMVWLDQTCYGNGKKGFYYVRCQREFLWGHMSTAYDPPKMIVDSKKLTGLQKRYMERKCRETAAKQEQKRREV